MFATDAIRHSAAVETLTGKRLTDRVMIRPHGASTQLIGFLPRRADRAS